ncbi:hypothetical protein P5V15_010203 [Pogonomyrmex californicus]
MLVFFGPLESWQLIIKSINIPATVKVNGTDYIILDCDYDLENTSSKGLVVKWFFNTNQVVYQWIYGRNPLADEPAAKYIDLTYKASDDPYTEYRAIKLNKPGIDLTGEYTCVISTFADERTANASMIVYSRFSFNDISNKSIISSKQCGNMAVLWTENNSLTTLLCESDLLFGLLFGTTSFTFIFKFLIKLTSTLINLILLFIYIYLFIVILYV